MNNFLNNFKNINRNASNSTKVIYTILTALILAGLLKKLFDNPTIILVILVLIISIILHEVAHGAVANINGDNTAKLMGRLTLNPIKHLDSIGLLVPMGLILMGSPFVIGWAKPIPVNYRNLKNGEFGVFLVSIAGVAANFLLVFIGATVIKLFPSLYGSNIIVHTVARNIIMLNLVLGIFNILPIPPLDGSKVLWSLGGNSIKKAIENLEQYGFFIIILLSYFGILWKIMNPVFNILLNIINMYIQ